MALIGRNQPCPCGSGIKYKKCCLLHLAPSASPPLPPTSGPTWTLQEDALDDLSNSVVDLLEARRFEDALGVCQRLLRDYPDVEDGLERSAMVHSALGDHATAAAFYRKTFAFVTHPSRRAHYENVEMYRELADQEERLVRDR